MALLSSIYLTAGVNFGLVSTVRLHVPTPTTFAPLPATLSEDVLAIPASHGIYALATPGNPPHISWSINLRRRLNRLLVPSYTALSGNLSPFAKKVESVSYWRVSSRLETSLILYELTREFYPDSYLRRLHLRMPWFVGLTQTNSFARLEVFNRLGGQAGARFGPFRTRDTAQLYEDELLSLHQLRRCTETLAPTPDHPGCIYGEMNQCLRPCQTAVTTEEYATESARVANFLATAGKSALQPLTASRDRAAAALDFEQAALAHKRIEKIQSAMAARDKVVTAADQFHGIALTRAADPDAVTLWPVWAGHWQSRITLYLQQETRSLDTLLRERLQTALAMPTGEGNRVEQIALFSRWYYSSWRDGYWFPFEILDRLNYRKLVKAISDLVKPGERGSVNS
jgi:excinuclease ABC subunit C